MADILSRLQALPQKIRVGVIGVGFIGEGIVYQASVTPGMEWIT
jgi:predicted homoserine dehydrogenase-like protein